MLSAVQKRAVSARPSPRQLAWQRLGLTMFVHFSVNTFTDREWGEGTEPESVFTPSALDPRQWARVAAECGFKLLILTCKHHDGFCLWPSKFTSHTVAALPGGRDVVGETAAACREYGIGFGVYLSPWDRHEKSYGDSPRYNRFFLNQLGELLSNYGKISSVWFDGACAEGADGRHQEYDWEAYYALIRKLQPEAVISGCAPDVRWCGNEAGKRRRAEWSVVNLDRSWHDFNQQCCVLEDLGSLEQLGECENPVWYPSEVDTSIRPGWFYHRDEDDRVKSLAELVDIYFNSAGHNAVLLLNVPPDQRGLFHETDVARLREFHDYLERAFSENLLPGNRGELAFDFGTEREFNCLELAEDVVNHGQRVEEYHLEIESPAGEARIICRGATIGIRELNRFPLVRARRGRVVIDSSRGEAPLLRVGLFRIPELAVPAAAEVAPPTREWSVPPGLPAEFVLDLGEERMVNGVLVIPPAGRFGHIFKYEICAGIDADACRRCVAGEFGNTPNNPQPCRVIFAEPVRARFLRLRALSTVDGGPEARIGGFEAI